MQTVQRLALKRMIIKMKGTCIGIGEAEDVQLLKSRLKQAEAARAAAEADTGQAAAAWDAEAAGLRKAAKAAESQAREAEAHLREAEQQNEALLQERQVH